MFVSVDAKHNSNRKSVTKADDGGMYVAEESMHSHNELANRVGSSRFLLSNRWRCSRVDRCRLHLFWCGGTSYGGTAVGREFDRQLRLVASPHVTTDSVGSCRSCLGIIEETT